MNNISLIKFLNKTQENDTQWYVNGWIGIKFLKQGIPQVFHHLIR